MKKQKAFAEKPKNKEDPNGNVSTERSFAELSSRKEQYGKVRERGDREVKPARRNREETGWKREMNTAQEPVGRQRKPQHSVRVPGGVWG